MNGRTARLLRKYVRENRNLQPVPTRAILRQVKKVYASVSHADKRMQRRRWSLVKWHPAPTAPKQTSSSP